VTSGPILAFDTSGPHCAAALVADNGAVLSSACEAMARGQAERLMDLLAGVLDSGGAVWGDLSAIAVGTGPGNFTGLRIAVAAARGLALALEVPAIGVTGFDAATLDAPRPCWAVAEAQGGRLYVQRIDADADAGIPAIVDADATFDAPVVRTDRLAPERLCVAIAAVARSRLGSPQPRPGPVYVRAPDAAPRRG
jgi:tRNA threonylcarbamoyl adenosine modification protein YeaZ